MADQFDTIIRGGTIVDGTGGAPYVGDVAIAGGIIRAVGKIDGTAAREIDASGLLVTPGFVDIHTHYDGQAIWSDRFETPRPSHGITTVVIGNCGVGFAPCRPADHGLLIEVMEGVEDIPGIVMAEGLSWDWESFPEYLDALEAGSHDIDIAAYLPHSPLRVYVMGERGANREEATADDLDRMRALAREAIEVGAVGFATSRVMVHKTLDGRAIPSFEAAFSEIEAIAGAMAEAGGGLIQVVPNFDFARSQKEMIEPMVRVAERTGQPLTFTFGVGGQGAPQWPATLQMIQDAQARGARVTGQVFPRPIGLITGLDLSIHHFCLRPSYREIAHLPLGERIEALRDPARRARILAEENGPGHPLVSLGQNLGATFLLDDLPCYEPRPETSVAAIAEKRGQTAAEAMYDMLLDDGGTGMFLVAMGNLADGKLDQVGELLQRDNVIVGLGDGGAHYGMICDSSYPTTLLAHWGRDRDHGRLPVEKIVKMLARDTAETVGLLDRGILAPGYKADVNLIDHAAVKLFKPAIVHDLPANGRRLDQRAEGYRMTMVSGEIIASDGVPNAARPGRLVRGRQAAPAG